MINHIIMRAFREWITGSLRSYKFGDKDLYSDINKKNIWHASNNPYIKKTLGPIKL
jgi:hypothetical protein